MTTRSKIHNAGGVSGHARSGEGGNITMWMTSDLRALVVEAAETEGRSVSNFMTQMVRKHFGVKAARPVGCTCNFLGGIHANDCAMFGQIDIEEAIASKVKKEARRREKVARSDAFLRREMAKHK